MKTPAPQPETRVHCLFYLAGDCPRPASYEYRSKGRPAWFPICQRHAEMACELYGGEARPRAEERR